MGFAIGIIGQAGTGKTTRLIQYATNFIVNHNWLEYESILALTFMHGSRKRLDARVDYLRKKYSINITCQTFDSFIYSNFTKFRKYLNINEVPVVDTSGSEIIKLSEVESSYPLSYIRASINSLFTNSVIKDLIKINYPLIIVDEFQDCEELLLEFVINISKCTNLIVAADDFQELSNNTTNKPVEWLKIYSQIKDLGLKDVNWRTSNSQLISTAAALRTDRINSERKIEVIPCPSHHLAAWNISAKILFQKWGRNGTIALISPVGTMKSKFIRETVERLHQPFEKTKKRRKRMAPTPFTVEATVEARPPDKEIFEIDKNKVITKKKINDLLYSNNIGPVLNSSLRHAKRKLNLLGQNTMSKDEFSRIYELNVHSYQSYSYQKNFKRRFLTIHGAKNREFDYVIVLWPYEAPSDLLYQRKLLYNAVTRAKEEACIIVQQKENNLEVLKKHGLFRLIV